MPGALLIGSVRGAQRLHWPREEPRNRQTLRLLVCSILPAPIFECILGDPASHNPVWPHMLRQLAMSPLPSHECRHKIRYTGEGLLPQNPLSVPGMTHQESGGGGD